MWPNLIYYVEKGFKVGMKRLIQKDEKQGWIGVETVTLKHALSPKMFHNERNKVVK
jgi:hypothetical protein